MRTFLTLSAAAVAVGLTMIPEEASAQWRGGWRGGGFRGGGFAWRGGWGGGFRPAAVAWRGGGWHGVAQRCMAGRLGRLSLGRLGLSPLALRLLSALSQLLGLGRGRARGRRSHRRGGGVKLLPLRLLRRLLPCLLRLVRQLLPDPAVGADRLWLAAGLGDQVLKGARPA
jgi:hypothetical protein